MKSTRSWKHLAPRFVGRHTRSAGTATAVTRPCLTIEPLDNRLLLSGAPSSIIIEPPGAVSGNTGILVELLKSGLKVSESEFALLKTLAPSPIPLPYPNANAELKLDVDSIQALNKTTPLLFQLDDELSKIGENLLTGQLTEKKVQDSTMKLDYLQIKLEEVIITSLTGDAQEKASSILGSLKIDVVNFVQGILSVDGAGLAPLKQTLEYVKIAGDFLKMDDLLLKAELDFVKLASPGVDLFDFRSKIDDVFLKTTESISKLDETAASILLPAVQTYKTNILGLLGSLEGEGDEDFEGGILLPEPTDDIII